jgi:hypothetical protein
MGRERMQKSPDQWPGLKGVKAYLLKITTIPSFLEAIT